MKLPKYRPYPPKNPERAFVECKALFQGKRKYLPGAFNSKESLDAYRQVCDAVIRLKTGDAKPPKQRSAVTIGHLLTEWQPWGIAYYGLGSKEYGHFRMVVRKIKPHSGVRVVEFGPKMLKQVRQSMIEARWSRKHINRQVNRLIQIFAWGIEAELVDASHVANLRGVKGLRKGKSDARETEDVRPVDWEVVQQVLPFVAPIVAKMVTLQYYSGMRSDELTAMRPCEIDRDRKTWVYTPGTHKNDWRGKEKFIVFGPQARQALLPYIDTTPEEQHIFSPRKALAELAEARRLARKTPLYGKAKDHQPKERQANERYDYHSYHQALKHGFVAMANADKVRRREKVRPKKGDSLATWLQERGIEYWNPHRLRHSRATVTKAEFGAEGVQAITGNTLSAAELYAERSIQLAMDIAEQIG